MAGAGKKTFTAGETLTASDVNTYLMEQSVMVFGGTAARSSAIPTPSEGMTSYRTDTQQIESYDGAEWRGMSGLQLVKKQTIGSGVSSVVVTGAFSSTYENYRIIVSGGVGSTTTNAQLKLGASATAYYAAGFYVLYSSTTFNGIAQSNVSQFGNAVQVTTNHAYGDVNLYGPNLAKVTGYATNAGEPHTAGACVVINGFLNDNTQHTSFTLTPASGTLTGGTIYVYGYGT